jgi:hypothetical protein
MASNNMLARYTYPNSKATLDNQCYMARTGVEHGAWGLVNTHWESRLGACFASAWPHLILSAGISWSGGQQPNGAFWKALSFNLTGDRDGALGAYLKAHDRLADLLERRYGIDGRVLREWLFGRGPHALWRKCHAKWDKNASSLLLDRLRELDLLLNRLGSRDNALGDGLKYPLDLYDTAFRTIEGFSRAWEYYHRAALLERQTGRKRAYTQLIGKAVDQIDAVRQSLGRLQKRLRQMSRRTGHTPHDAHALAGWCKELERVKHLMRQVSESGQGLPCFERLLYLRPCYFESNMSQITAQNTYHQPPDFDPCPWPVRRH